MNEPDAEPESERPAKASRHGRLRRRSHRFPILHRGEKPPGQEKCDAGGIERGWAVRVAQREHAVAAVRERGERDHDRTREREEARDEAHAHAG